jgi:hypothetical protein
MFGAIPACFVLIGWRSKRKNAGFAAPPDEIAGRAVPTKDRGGIVVS